MFSKSLSSSIFTVRFKRQLWISVTPSATVLRTQENDEAHDSSQKSYTSLLFGRLIASMEICETPHFDESHLSASFCSNALKISAKLGFLSEGKQLHSYTVKLGYDNEQSIQNQVLNLYVKCRAFTCARRFFDEMPVRNVVSWNTMISGSVGHNLDLLYFRKMLVERVEPNYITFISLIRTCIELNDIEIGKQLHCFVMKYKFGSDCFVSSSLVDLYAKCSLVEDARRAFDKMLWRDLVSWNVMVSCYVLNGLGGEAFEVFNLMRSEGVKGDDFTFSSLLSSFGVLGSSELGKQIHGLIIKLSYDLDVLVASALVGMYAKSGIIEDARKAFDGMNVRNVVSWTTMIVGYGRHGDGKEAMKLLRKMIRGGFDPDELTLASILSSCANLSATTEVVQLHAYAVKKRFEAFSSIANALINAYSKCGSIASALQSFSSITEPDLVTWTSMIGAYAFHGLSREAIENFEKMLRKGVRPDRIIFLGVLSACSHGGLVDEGLHYFTSMTRDHQILPDSEHYTCLIDLLGRAGHLDEAYNVITSMPFEPGSNALGAFIGACKVHGNIELAKWAANRLFMLEPNKPVNYTLMSNIYASTKSWNEVARMRKMMRDSCDYKVPGCSWMEIAGEVHSFVSSDKSHPQALKVYAMLGMLVRLMKEEVYMSNMDFLFGTVGGECVLNFLS
ncbi:hypothetical protein HHK36_027680 [Tetracentron sinense]|uniref:Uncharacterized protein n=1 Tax=Tetracentron sinense TaxID=13715 RepID=A0A834YDG6_TETSI|nr:hypothetical protein HHK36_027680 [Tetracentron sinense]